MCVLTSGILPALKKKLERETQGSPAGPAGRSLRGHDGDWRDLVLEYVRLHVLNASPGQSCLRSVSMEENPGALEMQTTRDDDGEASLTRYLGSGNIFRPR